MVKLKTILQTSLGPAIHTAFKDDWPLIHTYHLVNGSLTDCVKSTFHQIDKVASGKDGQDLVFYAVLYNDEVIGFTVTGPKCLLSFGLNVRFRTKAIVLDWWDQIRYMLGEEFVTWLFKKNVRAIDFVTRNGMEITEDNGDYVTLVHYCNHPINKVPCQQVG